MGLGLGVLGGWTFSSVSPTAPSPMRGISALESPRGHWAGRRVDFSDRSGRNKLRATVLEHQRKRDQIKYIPQQRSSAGSAAPGLHSATWIINNTQHESYDSLDRVPKLKSHLHRRSFVMTILHDDLNWSKTNQPPYEFI